MSPWKNRWLLAAIALHAPACADSLYPIVSCKLNYFTVNAVVQFPMYES